MFTNILSLKKYIITYISVKLYKKLQRMFYAAYAVNIFSKSAGSERIKIEFDFK